MKQNPSNDENGFKNLFFSIKFIQSLMGSDVEDEHSIFKSSLENEEQPCCSKTVNTVIERKVYCPICNNPFNVRAIEEHEDLCLEKKSKFFFERQPGSSDEEKSVNMIDEKAKMRGNLDQMQLVSAIYRQLKKCAMNEENKLTINVRRGFCFKAFLKTFRKSWNIKRMRNKYSRTFIGESGIDTERVSSEFYSDFVVVFHFFHFSLILKVVYGGPSLTVSRTDIC